MGAPLTPYFEEHGYECSITELNKSYDYHTRSREDASIPVDGYLIVTDYETFLSDETHEGMEGYEWKRVKFNFYIPLSEMEKGGRVAISTFDYYNESNEKFDRLLESGEQIAYSVNWNGVEYNDGIKMVTFLNNEYIYEDTFLFTDCWYDVCEFAVRVPVGYDGAVFSAYNHNTYIESIMVEGESLGAIDAAVLSNGDTLSFRLN